MDSMASPERLATIAHLSVIDVADGTDVDVRLAALEGSGVAPGRVDELSLAPSTEGGLDGVGRLLAQGARGAKESPSERHGDKRLRNNERCRRDGRGKQCTLVLDDGDGPSRISRAMLEALSRACGQRRIEMAAFRESQGGGGGRSSRAHVKQCDYSAKLHACDLSKNRLPHTSYPSAFLHWNKPLDNRTAYTTYLYYIHLHHSRGPLVLRRMTA